MHGKYTTHFWKDDIHLHHSFVSRHTFAPQVCLSKCTFIYSFFCPPKLSQRHTPIKNTCNLSKNEMKQRLSINLFFLDPVCNISKKEVGKITDSGDKMTTISNLGWEDTVDPVVCRNHSICTPKIRYAERCELPRRGPGCQPPCLVLNCSYVVEYGHLCTTWTCTGGDIVDPVTYLGLIIGGSICFAGLLIGAMVGTAILIKKRRGILEIPADDPDESSVCL